MANQISSSKTEMPYYNWAIEGFSNVSFGFVNKLRIHDEDGAGKIFGKMLTTAVLVGTVVVPVFILLAKLGQVIASTVVECAKHIYQSVTTTGQKTVSPTSDPLPSSPPLAPPLSSPPPEAHETELERFLEQQSPEQREKLSVGTSVCWVRPEGDVFGIWNDGIGVLGDSTLMKRMIERLNEELSIRPAQWECDLASFDVFLDMLKIAPEVNTSLLNIGDLLKDKICEYIGVKQDSPPTEEQFQNLLEIWHIAEYLNCDKLKETCHVCIEAWMETRGSNGTRWSDNKNAIINFFKKCGHQGFVNYAFLRRQDKGVTLLMKYYLPYFAQLLNPERLCLSSGEEDPKNDVLSGEQADHIRQALQGVTRFSLLEFFRRGGLEGIPYSKVFIDIVQHCTCLEELDMSESLKDEMDYVEWLCDAENSSYLNLDFVKKINMRMPDFPLDPFYHLHPGYHRPRRNPKLPNFKKFKSLLEKFPALLEIDLTRRSFKPATSEELLKDHFAFSGAINRYAGVLENESTLQMVVRGAQLLRDHPTLEVIYLTYPMTSGSTAETFLKLLEEHSPFKDFTFSKGITGSDRLIRRRAATTL